MRPRLRHIVATFGWWQWTVATVFVVALLGAGLFAAQTVRYSLHWSQHRDEPVERWMPLRYIARSYRVPPEVLRDALGLPPDRPGPLGDRRPLAEIAEEEGVAFEALRDTLLEAIARANTPPRPPPPPSE